MNHPGNLSDPVGYALAGFGRFCRNRLVPAFKRIDGSEIVALWKRDTDAAGREAREHGIPVGYGDFYAMLNDPRVDVVYTTSANSLHEEQAIAAAKAGKHVVCEKPMATTAEACSRIIDACGHAGVKLAVAHNLRYSGAVRQIKQMIDRGDLGEILTAAMTFTYETAQSPRSWVYNRQVAGGGVLMDLGVHCIDTLRYLMGNALEVKGKLKPSAVESTIDESAWLTMTFESGVIGQTFCSYAALYGNSLEVTGTLARMRVERFTLPDTDLEVVIERKTGTEVLRVNTGNTYGKLISDFSQALKGQKSVSIPGTEGLKNQQIIDAIYASGNYP